MNIVHYSFGIPPYKRGGLTKYFIDLCNSQNKDNNVIILIPDSSKKSSIKFYEYYCGIKVYKIYNSNPVPVIWGIKTPIDFMKKHNKNVFLDFFVENKVDVLHIHTLQGAVKEMFEAARELKIKIIYTTHDYFGICPKVNLWFNDELCDCNLNKCAKCNINALSIKKLKFVEKKYYPILKWIFKKMKIYKKKNNETFVTNNEYSILKKYYFEMFYMVDKFHFNSEIAEMVFKKYLNNIIGEVIPISNLSVKDNRKIRYNDKDRPIHIGYLGPCNIPKGFELLVDTLDKLNEKFSNRFVLEVFGPTYFNHKYIIKNKPYNYKNINEVYEKLDLVIVPSLWYETFSFICQEALSYGVPVLVSDRVGAKTIVSKIDSRMIYSCDKGLYEALYNIIEFNLVNEFSKKICDCDFDTICPDILKVDKLYG